MSKQITTRAVVTSEPSAEGKLNWNLEDVTISRDLKPNELLVRMVASGICHTDLVFSSVPAEAFGPYPKVLGHEGAGYVESIGSAVTVAKPGDPVLLSFDTCDECGDCNEGHPAFCQKFGELNTGAGEAKLYSEASGFFFGQSSFSNKAVVKEGSVVNATGLVRSDDELKLFAPMGCGFQTGAGTVDTFAKAGPKDTVVILGMGGVGLTGIMAAKINNCKTVIGVDRFPDRLSLAKSMGATHTLNTASSPDFNLVSEIHALTSNIGATIVIDTTGVVALIAAGMEATAKRGQMILVGVPPLDGMLNLHLITFLSTGKQLKGSMEGDCTPRDFIPKMVRWWREGKLPVEKLVGFYPVAEVGRALEDMHSGKTVKPVLVW